ncbi:MAG: gfo/Idh/MocA family oxidoreductase, partial [Clostridia bacterium]|nr:gfo/Idh/MocA family oxidoreductase [Clostridia bacterium]
SSIGSLKFFNEAHAPEGSAARCCDCKYAHSCPYSAYRIYFENEEMGYNHGNRDWPLNILTEEPDEKLLNEAIEKGPYGRCVFRCDNNVVDHQIVSMQMEDDVTVSLTMTAFTAHSFRRVKVMGTLGEIIADQRQNLVTVTPFGGESTVYDITKLTDDLSGHGGGDNRMMTEMFDALEKGGKVSSSIKDAIAPHLVAFAAEESRKRKGERIFMADFEKTNTK